jgi:hypothetical protein
MMSLLRDSTKGRKLSKAIIALKAKLSSAKIKSTFVSKKVDNEKRVEYSNVSYNDFGVNERNEH